MSELKNGRVVCFVQTGKLYQDGFGQTQYGEVLGFIRDTLCEAADEDVSGHLLCEGKEGTCGSKVRIGRAFANCPTNVFCKVCEQGRKLSREESESCEEENEEENEEKNEEEETGF